MKKSVILTLKKVGINYLENESLRKYNTWKVGGNADLLILAENSTQLKQAAEIATVNEIPLTVLGWGSNVLISESGLKGMTIINKSNNYSVIEKNFQAENSLKQVLAARHEVKDGKKYYDFSDLDYHDEGERVLIRVDSGFPLPLLINKTISAGLTGLQWYAGIPGTVGGAVINNIHGGTHFFSELVYKVNTIDNKMQTRSYYLPDLKMDYDYSVFHENDDLVIDVELILTEGDKAKAAVTAKEWATRKKLQPYNSAGCCFKNLTPEQQEKYNLPSLSWGFLIDQVLKLKGKKSNGAHISEKHAAFIETDGTASAEDILNLFTLIYDEAQTHLGITPEAEIFFLGFKPKEIARFV